MKINDSVKTFFRVAAWSWFVFGVVGILLELWRPGFVDYLIPVWIIFSVAAVAALITTL